MLQRWRAVGNIVLDVIDLRFESQTSRFRDKRELPLVQLAGLTYDSKIHIVKNTTNFTFNQMHYSPNLENCIKKKLEYISLTNLKKTAKNSF